MPFFRQLAAALLLALLFFTQPASAYSVLSHEQVVDLAWKTHIVPLLQARFPNLTPDQIKEAHAYAYGGAIIQDIGYYPFGSHQLSDMLHYVRSGAFVSNLIRESTSPDEYAFALGALAHYTSDTYGHPAVNQATAREYPKLERRFGPTVTYAEDPVAHLQTEFGFDVLEVAQQRYAPEAYHDFIGFQVAKPVFERAFLDTYGLDLNQVLTHEDLAIGTYRKTISTLLPKMTRVAYADFHKQIQQTEPTYVPKHLIYRLNKADYKKDWDDNYQKPGLGARFVGAFLRILPKIGPLKDLSLRIPDPATQKQFLDGMNTVVDRYHKELDVLKREPPDSPSLTLSQVDLDTGKPTAPGEYSLADQTYARYLQAVAQHPEKPLPPAARADLLHYFERASPGTLKLKRAQWKSLPADLKALQQAPTQPPQNQSVSSLSPGPVQP